MFAASPCVSRLVRYAELGIR